MATTTGNNAGIRIRGTPPNLFAALKTKAAQAQAISITLDTPDSATRKAFERNPPEVQTTPASDLNFTRLHLRLPKTMPPGTYHGTVEIENHKQELEIEVEPKKRLSIIPKRTEVNCAPGERVEFCVTLINRGNVSLSIPKVSGFGLYNKKGLDMAVGTAFQKKPEKDESRIDSFMDALQQGYGGVVKLNIQEGAGSLEPGDMREIKIIMHVPSQLSTGNEYWGIWTLHDYNYKIEIDVLSDKTS